MENSYLEAFDKKDLKKSLEMILRERAAEMPAIRVELMPPPAPAPTGPDNGGLREYLDVFRRHALGILVLAGCTGLVSYLVTLPQPRVYRAETALEIQSPNENFLNLKDFDPSSAGAPESYVEAQVKVLRGEELLNRAASRLKLESRPESWGGESLLSAWKAQLGLGKNSRATAPSREEMLSRLKESLVVRSAPQSRLVDIQFESPDPKLAAQFANTLANELIDHNLEIRLKSAERTAQSLSGSMGEMKSNMENSANTLQSYAGATGLILDQDGGTAADEKLRQVQGELSRAQADRASKQSRYEVAAAASPESLPDILDYGPLRDTQAKLAELKRQHAEVSATFAPTYFKVKSLAAQIEEMENVLQKEQSNILARIYNEFQSALRRERLLQQSYDEQTRVVSQQAAASVHYNTLKRDVDTNRTLYDAMLQKVKEAGIASAVRASSIRVISAASAPAKPYRPQPLLNAATGLLAGFFLATAFVLIRDQTDRTIRRPGQAATELDVTELGVIPSSGSGFDGLAMTAGTRRNGRRARRPRVEVGRSGPAEWVRSGSRLAESFRSVLASLWYIGRTGTRMRIFVVTSPSSREGKSTIVSHLGVTMANANRRVLLIDGDLRRPTLDHMFGLVNQHGLAEILADTARPIENYAFEELFQETEIPELFVLPGGSGISHIASLRFHERLIDLLARARAEFDVVLMDTPPAIEYADARILGGLADGVILVLRAGQTTRNAAWVTARRFQDDGVLLAGTILNDWCSKDGSYGLGVFRPPTGARTADSPDQPAGGRV